MSPGGPPLHWVCLGSSAVLPSFLRAPCSEWTRTHAKQQERPRRFSARPDPPPPPQQQVPLLNRCRPVRTLRRRPPRLRPRVQRDISERYSK